MDMTQIPASAYASASTSERINTSQFETEISQYSSAENYELMNNPVPVQDYEEEEEEDAHQAISIQSGRRSQRTSIRGSSSRGYRPQQPSGIGGDLVGSMKRGLRTQSGVSRNGGRLRILLFIAFSLFIVLTAVWIIRLYNRFQSLGGWSRVFIPPSIRQLRKQEL